MKIREIIKDLLSYPFTNWKSYLILGIILLITNLYFEIFSISLNEVFIPIIAIAEFVTGFLTWGYLIKIIKSTLNSENVLPKFNGWLNIIINGFKASLVLVAYSIPYYIIIVLLIANLIITNRGFNPIDFVGFTDLIFFLYTIVIIPIFALALANMAFDEGRLLSAFSFGEIWGDIREMGFVNIIALYLLLGTIFILFRVMHIGLNYLVSWIDPIFLTIIQSMILIPYLYIFAARTVALFYRSSVV